MLLFLVAGMCSSAQTTDRIPDPSASTSYIRFNYDNDFFSATDRYYTQGISLEYISPLIKRTPLTYPLIRLGSRSHNYDGIAFQQDCFTPSSIRRDTVFTGDRPYAATMFGGPFLVSIDPVKKRRLTTRLDLGIIGPCAKCEAEQKAIHKALVNLQPLGWQFQVASDYIVNYSAELEQGLFTREYLMVAGLLKARAGTLYDDVSTGLMIRTGYMASYFSQLGVVKQATSHKFQCYFTAQAREKLVGYNAALQGGMFNRSSIYTVAGNHVERLVFMASASLVLCYKRVSLEYGKTYISPEFYHGLDHGWGHCNITVCF